MGIGRDEARAKRGEEAREGRDRVRHKERERDR